MRVPVTQALPAELTMPASEPAAPAMACLDRGEPTWCTGDLADWADALRAWGRGMVEQFRKIRDAQPQP